MGGRHRRARRRRAGPFHLHQKTRQPVQERVRCFFGHRRDPQCGRRLMIKTHVHDHFPAGTETRLREGGVAKHRRPTEDPPDCLRVPDRIPWSLMAGCGCHTLSPRLRLPLCIETTRSKHYAGARRNAWEDELSPAISKGCVSFQMPTDRGPDYGNVCKIYTVTSALQHPCGKTIPGVAGFVQRGVMGQAWDVVLFPDRRRHDASAVAFQTCPPTCWPRPLPYCSQLQAT